VRWRAPEKVGNHNVCRSTCGRYELNEGKPRDRTLWSVTTDPAQRGTWEFKVLFIEPDKEVLLDKLDDFESARRAAEAATTRTAA